jgi:phosphoglycolate phosphatase-like HAD superfamily hydrolase
MAELLVLFDVDGTLLLTHDEVYVDASRDALLAVWGSAPDGPDVPGDTATAHTRRALRGAGFTDDEIDAGLGRWCSVFSGRYVELLRTADTSHWRVPEDAAATLGHVERRALLTGNPEAVARARLERLGLADLFAAGQGAFGCEREDRVELFELARSRSGGWPAERTVAVGDTPLDVSSAHEAGARCVAVTTGAYDEEQLRGADVLIRELKALPAALASLA